jgi:hypothetical protein
LNYHAGGKNDEYSAACTIVYAIILHMPIFLHGIGDGSLLMIDEANEKYQRGYPDAMRLMIWT